LTIHSALLVSFIQRPLLWPCFWHIDVQMECNSNNTWKKMKDKHKEREREEVKKMMYQRKAKNWMINAMNTNITDLAYRRRRRRTRRQSINK
jgi:hypothetical protein